MLSEEKVQETDYEVVSAASKEATACETWLVRSKNTGALAIFKPVSGEGKGRGTGKESASQTTTALDFFPLRRGVVVGDGARKEVAAFVLDHEGFAGVPRTRTAFVWLEDTTNNKSVSMLTQGSLQDYVAHQSSAEDVGASVFDVDCVHRIGILDIRLLNLDRHLGNLLVVQGGKHLVPIDHGLSLPSFRALEEVRFEWSHWKQCHVPFAPATIDYVRRLEPLRDAELLHTLGIRAEEILAMVLSTMLLQFAVLERQLTLFHVAQMVQRPHETKPSVLEQVVDRVIESRRVDPLPLFPTAKTKSKQLDADGEAETSINVLVHVTHQQNQTDTVAHVLAITRLSIRERVDAYISAL